MQLRRLGSIRKLALFALVPFLAPAAPSPAAEPARSAVPPGPMLQRFLKGPLADQEEIVFAARVSGRDHWYVTFGYYSCRQGPGRDLAFGEFPDGRVTRGYGEGGRLCRLNLRTGQVKVLLDDPRGGVRDPQVHYDGKKILFSYRKGESPTYHLYEINSDGTGLKQLTDGPDDDIEPTYVPDGSIVFCSSRCRRFVNCWFTRVATLYRCDGDGKNVRMLSSNNDHDNTPWVLPDGRIVYMRWEYVDRSQVHFHHLWTVNPDGTSQMVYYGNEFAGTSMLDAKPVPGSSKVVASFSPGHGLPEHMGHVTLVDPSAGPDILTSARRISKKLYRDPYALSERCFLVANREGLHVMDGEGNAELVYKLPPGTGLECHEPRPLAPRPRERILPDRTDLSKDTGTLVLADVYSGRSMNGVKPGEIKKLLVLEQLPEPIHFSGGMEPISINGTFTLARVLGTVPVEDDGSAHVELPALRSLFFVALDEKDQSVKRMQSFVTLQPGERNGCVGCHEQRSKAPHYRADLKALKQPPARIAPIRDVPDVLDFPRDVQPILDKHCVSCHNPDHRDGGVDLCGDHTPFYSTSYWTINQKGLVADGRNQPYSNRAPRSIGSSASRLMKFIDGSHKDVKLSDHERRIIRLWIETSATYPGTYASLGCGMYPVNYPQEVLQGRCASCHSQPAGPRGKGPTLRFGEAWSLDAITNLTRPEKSLLLRAPLARKAGGLELCKGEVFASTADPDYKKLLTAISAAAGQLKEHKRFDMPGFRANEHYVREMQRFGILAQDLPAGAPVDVYATDQAYWKSFWHRPAGVAARDRSASSAPVVAAQLYVWTQQYGKKKEKLEDHLDEVFAATKRAGYDAVQGFLNFHDTAESAAKVAAALKKHNLTMPAAYAGGTMHTRGGGEEAIGQIVRQAKNGAAHGLKLVVHNPQPLRREKTDSELTIQAKNLDRLGEALGQLGVRLAIHSHDPEMRSGAREWYHVLRHTDPAKVGFCLDLHWVLRGKQDPYRLLEDAGKRVLDLHLRNSREGVWSEDLDHGDIDHAQVRKVLEKIGYQGSYTVELAYEGKTPQTRPLEENLRRSRAYVRRVLGH